MTQKQANQLPALTIQEALKEAFRAGEAYIIGGHCLYIQTHLDEEEAVLELLKAVDRKSKDEHKV